MTRRYAFVARIEAKPDRAEDVAALLTRRAPARAGRARNPRLVRRPHLADDVLDLRHLCRRGRASAHLDGQIAAALMANADELLASPPEIMPADVLAADVKTVGVGGCGRGGERALTPEERMSAPDIALSATIAVQVGVCGSRQLTRRHAVIECRVVTPSTFSC